MLNAKQDELLDGLKLDFQTDDKESKFKKLAMSFFNFVKKHWKLLSIITAIIAIIITVYSAIPVISINETKLANLNTSVRLEMGQTAKLKFRNMSVSIKSFNDNTCPVGVTCFGSGQQSLVYLSVSVDGQEYTISNLTPPDGSKYQIKTLDTDYKTYVNVKIIKL